MGDPVRGFKQAVGVGSGAQRGGWGQPQTLGSSAQRASDGLKPQEEHHNGVGWGDRVKERLGTCHIWGQEKLLLLGPPQPRLGSAFPRWLR